MSKLFACNTSRSLGFEKESLPTASGFNAYGTGTAIETNKPVVKEVPGKVQHVIESVPDDVQDVHVLETIDHVEKSDCTKTCDEAMEQEDLGYVMYPGWKKPVPLDAGYSLVKYEGRHNSRSAVQRRYTVRRRLDPARHEAFKARRNSYMKQIWYPKQKMKKAINFIAQCANKIAAHGTKVKTATQARKKPRKKPEVELESATAPEKLKCAENTPNEERKGVWEVLQEYQPHAQKEPEKHDSEPDHHTEPEAEMGIEPGKESAEMESEPIRNCEMEPQQQLSAKSTPKKRRRGLWDQPQPQKRKRAAKKAARTRRENATKAARRVTPTLISTTTTGESLETYLPKRDLIKLHNVDTYPTCPFDQYDHPGLAVEWYKARVDSLQSALDTAIQLNLQQPKQEAKLPPAVKLRKTQYYTDVYSKNEPDSDNSVSIEKLPILVKRCDDSSPSSFEDYSTLDDFMNNHSSSDEEISTVDAFAYFDMTNEDYRNLGRIHQGPSDKPPTEHDAIKESVMKVQIYYEKSESKNAFKN